MTWEGPEVLRVGFLGCVEFSEAALRAVLAHPRAEVVGVVSRRSSSFHGDFRDLTAAAAEVGVPALHFDRRAPARLRGFFEELRPDILFCFGWPFLLSRDVRELAPRGAVGFHPSALPENRGRHPLVWALALGLPRTACSFFVLAEGADTGPVLSQEPLEIEPEDDARRLYDRMVEVALPQLGRLVTTLDRGEERPVLQDEARANHWRRRGPEDGRIDFRMTGEAICCLVRALARPYPGAHLVCGEEEVKVWRARPGPDAPRNLEPGKVLGVDSSRGVLVKCWGGTVWLEDMEPPLRLEEGEYL